MVHLSTRFWESIRTFSYKSCSFPVKDTQKNESKSTKSETPWKTFFKSFWSFQNLQESAFVKLPVSKFPKFSSLTKRQLELHSFIAFPKHQKHQKKTKLDKFIATIHHHVISNSPVLVPTLVQISELVIINHKISRININLHNIYSQSLWYIHLLTNETKTIIWIIHFTS